MGKAMRFFLRHTCWSIFKVVAVAALLVIGGCWCVGTTDGIFGIYARGFLLIGAILIAMFGILAAPYTNIALSMGAKRSDCFWALELCALIDIAVFLGLSLLVRIAVRPFEEDLQNEYLINTQIAVLAVLFMVFLAQISFVYSNDTRPIRRTVWSMLVMTSACILASASIFLNETGFVIPHWFMMVACPVLSIGTVVLGAVHYWIFQKAVVRT